MPTKTQAKPRTGKAKADRLGELLAHVKQFETEIKDLKAYFSGKGKGDYPGEKWTIKVSERSQIAVDVKKLRAECDEEWLKMYEVNRTSKPITARANPSKGIVPLEV